MKTPKTLPELVQEWRVSLDAARAIVRQRADLCVLGTRYGPTRVYSETEAETIRAALEERQASRRGKKAVSCAG